MAPPKIPYNQLSASGKYYRDHPEARKKKAKTDKKVNAKPAQLKKRREAGKKRRDAIKKGKNVKGKDYDHAVNRFVSSKKNRGRKEKSRIKGRKRRS